MKEYEVEISQFQSEAVRLKDLLEEVLARPTIDQLQYEAVIDQLNQREFIINKV